MLDSTTVVSVRMMLVLIASCATPYWPNSSLTRRHVFGRMTRKHLSRNEVHHRRLPHPQEVLEERIAADADDRLTERQPFQCWTTRALRMFSEV